MSFKTFSSVDFHVNALALLHALLFYCESFSLCSVSLLLILSLDFMEIFKYFGFGIL